MSNINNNIKCPDGKKARELAEKKYNEVYKGLQDTCVRLIFDTIEKQDFEFELPVELKNPKYFDKIKKFLDERFFIVNGTLEDDKIIIKFPPPEEK